MSGEPHPFCVDIRRRLLGEPHGADPAISEHLAGCAACSGYRRSVLAFESRLQRALQIDLPTLGAPVVDLASRRPRTAAPRWLAYAASLIIAVSAIGLWLSSAEPALAREVVGHMAGEPQAWDPNAAPVAAAKLDDVLDRAGVRLRMDSTEVSYASACEFRGRIVPHLVVRTAQGPVTLMILSHETAKSPMNFDEQGYRGTIVPVVGHGSIAVITRGASVELAPIVQTLRQELVWLPRGSS